MIGRPVVTAAVVVKDRRELMARCLEGLLAQDVDGGFEIVVVDNGSRDGTFELVEAVAASSQVPVRVERDRGSLGRIRNRAVAMSAAAIVAFVDSDCVAAPGWLAAGMGALAEGGSRVGVVQGRTLPDPSVSRRRLSATQELTSFTGRFESCNIFYRVEALRAAGGFDEDVGFFGEDTAAGWAVTTAGWGSAFAPNAVVHHVITEPGLTWHLRRALGYGNWNALVRRFPDMRQELLWHRWFLRPRSAAFTAATLGLVLALRWRLSILAALPYALIARPAGHSRHDLVDTMDALAFDAAVFCGLVRGSLRERTIVL